MISEVHDKIKAVLRDRLPGLALENDDFLALVSLACVDAVAYSACASLKTDGLDVTPDGIVERVMDRLGAPHSFETVPNHTTLLDLCLFTALSVMVNTITETASAQDSPAPGSQDQGSPGPGSQDQGSPGPGCP